MRELDSTPAMASCAVCGSGWQNRTDCAQLRVKKVKAGKPSHAKMPIDRSHARQSFTSPNTLVAVTSAFYHGPKASFFQPRVCLKSRFANSPDQSADGLSCIVPVVGIRANSVGFFFVIVTVTISTVMDGD